MQNTLLEWRIIGPGGIEVVWLPSRRRRDSRCPSRCTSGRRKLLGALTAEEAAQHGELVLYMPDGVVDADEVLEFMRQKSFGLAKLRSGGCL